jgi:hypothetical protein
LEAIDNLHRNEPPEMAADPFLTPFPFYERTLLDGWPLAVYNGIYSIVLLNGRRKHAGRNLSMFEHHGG